MLLLPIFINDGDAVISAALCMSPCSSDYIISNRLIRVRRVVSEDSHAALQPEPFLLIARTSRIVTATDFVASTGGFAGCSSI